MERRPSRKYVVRRSSAAQWLIVCALFLLVAAAFGFLGLLMHRGSQPVQAEQPIVSVAKNLPRPVEHQSQPEPEPIPQSFEAQQKAFQAQFKPNPRVDVPELPNRPGGFTPAVQRLACVACGGSGVIEDDTACKRLIDVVGNRVDAAAQEEVKRGQAVAATSGMGIDLKEAEKVRQAVGGAAHARMMQRIWTRWLSEKAKAEVFGGKPQMECLACR